MKKNTYATKAPRLARVGKNTNNFTIIPDSITTVLRQFPEKISSNCRIVMCLVEPNDGDNTNEALRLPSVVGVVSDRTERHRGEA